MADILTPEQRHRNMSRIRAKDTKPEMLVRRGIHGLGYRYRLHDRTLPGCPDLVFPRYSAVVFVHGCFWHGHKCHLAKLPESQREFWLNKLSRNMERDKKALSALSVEGWRVLTVWECALRGKRKKRFEQVLGSIGRFLEGDQKNLQLLGVVD
jgi:DNA mismatch endonuclease, patch repair protein